MKTSTNRTATEETWDAITRQEEQDLTNLMSEYDFAIKDAERFVDMLQQRLTDLDVVSDDDEEERRFLVECAKKSRPMSKQ
jgi:hypothetical protein